MIVLDATVLIAHLDDSDAHHRRAEALLLSSAHETFGASLITLAEVLVAPARAGKMDRATTALRQLGVETIDLGRNASENLALLRAGTGLKLPDCCVLLAAEPADSAVATFDHKVAAAARERGIAVIDG